jgi:hypothetical protein
MIDSWIYEVKKTKSSVWQKIFDNIIAIAFEQHISAAQIADLLIRPFDHAMALARLGIKHFPSRSYLKALFGA